MSDQRWNSLQDRDASSSIPEQIPFLDDSESDHGVELSHLDSTGSRHQNHGRGATSTSIPDDRFGDDFVDDGGGSPAHLSDRNDRVANPTTIRSIASRILGLSSRNIQNPQWSARKPKIRPSIFIWRSILVLLITLGSIQLATLLLSVAAAYFPEKFDHAYRSWREQDALPESSRWPTDYTADIHPVTCHSHNDYWRRIPLKSAIKAGCSGVEADVWLRDGDLLVGHAESALTPARTLQTLYINPLLGILNDQNPTSGFQSSFNSPRNGVFDTNTSQTLVLLIDFKTNYQDLWPVVSEQLQPLRDAQYLTYFDGSDIVQGPITVVVTGNAPFEYVVAARQHRDMFFDAPLDLLASLSTSLPVSTYDSTLESEYLSSISDATGNDEINKNQGQGHSGHQPTDPAIFSQFNSFYASVDFSSSIGPPRPYLSPAQREKVAAQIAGAHSRGLKVRYWDVPQWPIGLRNYLWRELVKMGVDYLNVDDLNAATHGDWRSGWSIWGWSLWGGQYW